MEVRKLGLQGLMASQLGLGCMGMSDFYGERNDEESLKVFERAYDLGIRLWDTADAYGPHLNEELVGKAIKPYRSQIVLCTKFGILRDPNDPNKRGLNGRPEYVKKACEESLKRLKTEVIDLYYMHRRDPDTPIEDTVGAMGDLVKEGKVRTIGLSETSIETLRKAHATFPITALQSEYSLWSRDPEGEILQTCKELGIAFVAYSPLGRGFLTGQIKNIDDLAKDDARRFGPRFQGENFQKNLLLVEKIEQLAKEKECTASQLALAWVIAQGQNIFPIPGTKRIKYLEENAAVLKVKLTTADFATLNEIAPINAAAGPRYPEGMMKLVGR